MERSRRRWTVSPSYRSGAALRPYGAAALSMAPRRVPGETALHVTG
ncbi:hypothetical protein SHJG_3067 [Streptomyces hygroscopicus subsp. jinggangensis 5008]|nr:hypothetical protein SHJG_3067 [Streptomyces hygroscopicus subsp. jinggangensis 5008]AGF62497.1 hypothetical protein SHJGH_2831 [Streptomyces hygroscopicus subsp. jinggangensis TL01]